MATGNGNAAYNFEMFEPQKQRTEPQIKVVRNSKHTRVQDRDFMLRVVTCVAIFFVGIISVLFSQIAMTEVTEQVSEKTDELETLQNEYRMLENEIESLVAFPNIDTTVTRDMGMTKLREDQITYVNLSEGDVSTTPNGESGGWFGKIWNTIKNTVAYIGQQ